MDSNSTSQQRDNKIIIALVEYEIGTASILLEKPDENTIEFVCK